MNILKHLLSIKTKLLKFQLPKNNRRNNIFQIIQNSLLAYFLMAMDGCNKFVKNTNSNQKESNKPPAQPDLQRVRGEEDDIYEENIPHQEKQQQQQEQQQSQANLVKDYQNYQVIIDKKIYEDYVKNKKLLLKDVASNLLPILNYKYLNTSLTKEELYVLQNLNIAVKVNIYDNGLRNYAPKKGHKIDKSLYRTVYKDPFEGYLIFVNAIDLGKKETEEYQKIIVNNKGIDWSKYLSLIHI